MQHPRSTEGHARSDRPASWVQALFVVPTSACASTQCHCLHPEVQCYIVECCWLPEPICSGSDAAWTSLKVISSRVHFVLHAPLLRSPHVPHTPQAWAAGTHRNRRQLFHSAAGSACRQGTKMHRTPSARPSLLVEPAREPKTLLYDHIDILDVQAAQLCVSSFGHMLPGTRTTCHTESRSMAGPFHCMICASRHHLRITLQ